MSLTQLTTLFNITGTGIVLLVHWIAMPRDSKAMFRPWTVAYSCVFTFLVIDLYASLIGHNIVLTSLWNAVVATSAWYFAETGKQAQGRNVPAWSLPTLITLSVGTGVLLTLVGVQFPLSGLVPASCLSIAMMWLGSLFLLSKGHIPRIMAWLGGPLVLSGIMPFTFPIFAATPWGWVGYWVCAVLNILMGIGMLVFQLRFLTSELEQKNKDLLILDELKSNFISVMSHELRTPVGAIKSATFLLQNDKKHPLAPKQAEIVEIITSHAKRLHSLVVDVLDYARIESGLFPYDYDPNDLGLLAERVGSEIRYQYEDKGVALEIVIADEPVIFLLDHPTLARVISNLLTNALKFTPKGGHVVMRVYASGDDAYLEVGDDGIGISEQNLQQIFTKFYQVDGTGMRQAEGAGLGLCVCKAIVEEGHAGRIQVTSTLGKGTTFQVILPMRSDEPALLAAQAKVVGTF